MVCTERCGGPAGAGAPPSKKPRCSSGTPPGAGGGAGGGAGAGAGALRDVSYAEAAKLATAQDYSFFDRVRKALRSQHVYDNFLRCVHITLATLVQMNIDLIEYITRVYKQMMTKLYRCLV